MTRVDQKAVEVVFQDRPDRLPVDPGRLHRDLRDSVRRQPVVQRQQTPHGRRERLERARHASRAEPGTRTHAVTDSLCTSSAPGRSTIVSTTNLLARTATVVVAEEPPKQTSLMVVLKATVRGSGEAPTPR